MSWRAVICEVYCEKGIQCIPEEIMNFIARSGKILNQEQNGVEVSLSEEAYDELVALIPFSREVELRMVY